jgi:hypothetical protein
MATSEANCRGDAVCTRPFRLLSQGRSPDKCFCTRAIIVAREARRVQELNDFHIRMAVHDYKMVVKIHLDPQSKLIARPFGATEEVV